MQTKRLLLRPFTLDDAEDFFPLVSKPEILKFTGETPLQSIDEVKQLLIERPLQDYTKYGFGRMACIELSSNKLIGFSGLKFLPEYNCVDIGYRFLPEYWSQGYATESARLLMEHGRHAFNLSKIIGLVVPENHASAHVLTKLGLQYHHKIKLTGWDKEIDWYEVRY